MAVNGNFAFKQLKLHNSYNVGYANHRTEAVVLPAIVVEENYKQQQKSSDTKDVFTSATQLQYKNWRRLQSIQSNFVV